MSDRPQGNNPAEGRENERQLLARALDAENRVTYCYDELTVAHNQAERARREYNVAARAALAPPRRRAARRGQLGRQLGMAPPRPQPQPTIGNEQNAGQQQGRALVRFNDGVNINAQPQQRNNANVAEAQQQQGPSMAAQNHNGAQQNAQRPGGGILVRLNERVNNNVQPQQRNNINVAEAQQQVPNMVAQNQAQQPMAGFIDQVHVEPPMNFAQLQHVFDANPLPANNQQPNAGRIPAVMNQNAQPQPVMPECSHEAAANNAGNAFNNAGNAFNIGNALNNAGNAFNIGNPFNNAGNAFNIGNPFNNAGNAFNIAGNAFNNAGNPVNIDQAAFMNANVPQGLMAGGAPQRPLLLDQGAAGFQGNFAGQNQANAGNPPPPGMHLMNLDNLQAHAMEGTNYASAPFPRIMIPGFIPFKQLVPNGQPDAVPYAQQIYGPQAYAQPGGIQDGNPPVIFTSFNQVLAPDMAWTVGGTPEAPRMEPVACFDCPGQFCPSCRGTVPAYYTNNA
ncbi:hypothetical protein CDD81_4778 [Ophiocordyceps australis]|uniref:Uncharacterized protein n=1 Tax=Ophiocordyceps australis TaxID=1399860 RepID=A0A2C5YBF2_9HYPO|nr:hypothetical protein CDD81_4778 [Ophiocordyceps australis]